MIILLLLLLLLLFLFYFINNIKYYKNNIEGVNEANIDFMSFNLED
jgi:hypothetical protein